MGTWGAGNFENDDAGDWAWELDDATDHSLLTSTLQTVTEADGYLEAPDAANALAAAEVVATIAGKPMSGDLPDSVEEFRKRVTAAPSPELISLAVSAVKRIESDSELKELWEESGSYDEWKAVIADLLSRL